MSHPRLAFCRQCNAQIDPHRESGHYQQVVGFVKLRARGANEVKLRRNRAIYICKDCMGMMIAGINPAQEHLFDVEP